MSQTNCPICETDSRLLFLKNAIPIMECRTCRHRFTDYASDSTHVQSQYGDDYFTGGAVGYSDYLAERHLLRNRGRRYARLMKTFTVPGRMLDVGAAAGFLLEGFRDEQWSVAGIEPNATMAAQARNELDINVHTSALADYIPDRPYDLVSAIQLIGHVVDAKQAAHCLGALTRMNGYCLIETWDHASLCARAFGRAWHEYSPPSVLHFFNDGSLRQLMRGAGFFFVRRGRMLKWIDGQHAKSLFAHKVQGARGAGLLTRVARLIPDRLAVPYPGDDLKWWLFQKNE